MESLESALVVRRSIHIEGPAGAGVAGVRELRAMAGWWDASTAALNVKLLSYGPRIGGPLVIEGKHGEFPYRFDCTIVTLDLAREFTVDWTFPAMGWQAPARITLRHADALYGTLVETLLHSFENIGPAAVATYQGFERGWQAQELIGLKASVEGA